MLRRRDPPRLTIRRASPRPAWVSLSMRLALVLGLIGIALAAIWLDRGGLRDTAAPPDSAVSFPDVLYFTVITVTTVGYGDIVPVTERARMVDTFLLTPIRIFVWLIFLGTAYQFLLRNVWEGWRMSRIQAHLHDHVIVVGFGAGGSEAVRELLRRDFPARRIVVIDPRPAALEAAARLGVAVLEGDATRNATLEAVRIPLAKAVTVAAGRDDTSILVVLTARGLAPAVPISVVVSADDNEELARQAGATTVINPASFAGLLLAGSTQGAHLAEYLADLAASAGRVALRERQATPQEVGRPLSAITTGLGVRIYRAGQCYGFEDPEAAALRPGDTIIEILPRGAGPA